LNNTQKILGKKAKKNNVKKKMMSHTGFEPPTLRS